MFILLINRKKKTRYGFLALGGQTGMLMIKDLSTGWFDIKTAGKGMNNSICLSQHDDGIYMTVCNNDQTISVFTVPNMEKIQLLKMSSAINYSKFNFYIHIFVMN
jgi:WD40 repeat protein